MSEYETVVDEANKKIAQALIIPPPVTCWKHRHGRPGWFANRIGTIGAANDAWLRRAP